MAQLIVRNLDDDVRDKIRDLAQRHGRSMEEEVRDILRAAVVDTSTTPAKLGSWCVERFTDEDFDEEFPEWRGFPAQPVNFD